MPTLAILCVDDEPEVLDALLRDLAPFEEVFSIDAVSSAEEARHSLTQSAKRHEPLAMILCDHVMPGQNGVDLMIELHQQEAYRSARKLLVTGQAGLDDTVAAINRANLHHYIAKPWKKEELLHTVRTLLTDFVIETCDDLLPYMQVLDTERLMLATLRRNPGDS